MFPPSGPSGPAPPPVLASAVRHGKRSHLGQVEIFEQHDLISPWKITYTLEDLTAGTYKFHPFRTENDLNQTSVIMFQVNDSGVYLPGNEHIWGNGKPCSKVPW